MTMFSFNPKRKSFQTEAPLVSIGDTSLDYKSLPLSILHGDADGQIFAPKLQTFAPAVICGPRLIGKTTQARFIYHVLNQAGSVHPIFVPEKTISQVRTEEDLRDVLSTTLRSSRHLASGYLSDILRGSDLLKRTLGITVLFIEHVESLPKRVLNWLLRGLVEIEHDAGIRELAVQVVIDGSFTIEALTGPTSRFPLQQLFPREFYKAEQKTFVSAGFKYMGRSVTPEAHKALWEITNGDKYLTQALCQEIQRADLDIVDEAAIQVNSERLVDALRPTDGLIRLVYTAFADLSEEFDGNEFKVSRLLSTVGESWHTLGPGVCRILYEGGLVRRTDNLNVDLRAPFILELHSRSQGRVQAVRALMSARFPLSMIRDDFLDAARRARRNAIYSAYRGTLKSLQIGFGVKESSSAVKVQVATLDNGQYTGTWVVSTDPDIAVGSEVVCMAIGVEHEPNTRSSELFIFPCG